MFQSILSLISGHEAVAAGLGVAILDFVFAINPSVESNGLVHWIYGFLSGKKPAA